MKYLVGDSDCTLGGVEDSLRIIEAESRIEAIRKYKQSVSIFDQYIRAAVLDRSTIGFASRFLLATEKERNHFMKAGEVLASPALIRRRIAKYFEDRPDIAAAYSEYLCDESSEEKTAKFPADFWEHLIVTHDDNNLFQVSAIPFNDIRII